MKACPHCSKQIQDAAVHCGYCGGQIGDSGGAETILGMSPVTPGDARKEDDEEDFVATVALPALRPEDFARLRGELPPVIEPSPTEPRLSVPGREVASVPMAREDAAPTPALHSTPKDEPSWATAVAEPAWVPSAPDPEEITAPQADPDEPVGARRAQDAPTLVLDSPLEGLAEALEVARQQKQGLAAPIIDFGDEPEPEDEPTRGGGLGRTLALVGLIAVPLVGLLTAAAIYLAGGQIRVRLESRVAAGPARDEYQVTLNVIVEEGDPKEPLVLTMFGKDEAFEGNRSFVFRIPKGELKTGHNPLDAVVKQPNGDEVGRLRVTISVDYTFDVERTVLRPGDTSFTAMFRVAEGANLYVDGASVRPSDDGRLAVSVGLADVLSRIDALPQPGYPYKLAFRVRRADGSEHPYAETVQLVLPSAELEVWRPARQYVTVQPRVTIVGKSEPGAEVRVDGRRIRSGADGSFQYVHPLPATGDHRIDVQAVKRGVVDALRSLDLRRVAPADMQELSEEARLKAEDWAGGKALRNPEHAALLAGAAGELKGRTVVLGAKVLSEQQGPEAVALVLSTCGRADACLVWAELGKGRLLVGTGERGTFFGTVDGTRALPRPGGDKVQVPFVSLEYAVGG